MAADGRGAILLADPEQPDRDAQLLVRAPGGDFTAAPAPDAVLQAGERLVANATRPDARALLAVIGGADAEAATLVAPTGADGTATAVLRLDAAGWHREAIEAGGALRPVALAAAGPKRAWLLGTAGDRVVLLHREPAAGGEPRWVPTVVPDALLAGEALPAAVADRRRGRAAGGPAHGDDGRRLAGPARDARRSDRARRRDRAPRGRRPAGARRDPDGARPPARRPPPRPPRPPSRPPSPTATPTATPTPTDA